MAKDLDATIVPFIMSTAGAISRETIKLMQDIGRSATRRGFIRDVVNRTKAVVAAFEHKRLQGLKLRHAAGKLYAGTLPSFADIAPETDDTPHPHAPHPLDATPHPSDAQPLPDDDLDDAVAES